MSDRSYDTKTADDALSASPGEKMRAVVIARFGEPSELAHEEVPLPRPKQGEVLVKIRAAAVNRSDWLNVRGVLPVTTLPRVPGRDFAGTVVEGPPELWGQEVWGTGGGDIGFTRDGSHAEYVALPQEAVVPKPAGLSLEETAASGLAYLTAASALLGLGDLQGGEAVLVTGAAGGVGSAAVGIARWKGALAIGAIKDESERPAAENAGAEVIIDTSQGG